MNATVAREADRRRELRDARWRQEDEEEKASRGAGEAGEVQLQRRRDKGQSLGLPGRERQEGQLPLPLKSWYSKRPRFS